MKNIIVHWEIAVKNLGKAKEYYCHLFDWQTEDMPGMDYAMVQADPAKGQGIGGGIMQSQPNIPTYVTFYVHVDDTTAYLEKAQKLGGKIIVPRTEIPNIGHFGMFADPDGNVIGLYEGKV